MVRQCGSRAPLRRRLARWNARQSEQLAGATSVVIQRLDALNRALAQHAVPRSRRAGVETLVRERQRRGPTLEVIEGGDGHESRER
ncbi:hypothetical protein [Salicola sp. Rm-C-2C1-2]|uniref:hypothetical protein n=1 Tax=Salicola sp. Rm-C-2C1-2 TaxID=3141321 RepID=UPI0032E45E5F